MANPAQPAVRGQALLRAGVGLVVGAVVAAVTIPVLGLAAGLLAGWGALAVTSVVWILVVVWPMDAAATRSHATAENPGRRLVRLVAVVGSVASLAAVAVVLLDTRDEGQARAFMLAGVASLSVVASWALIQIDYMLRVAAVYYTDPVGGIDFNQDDDPMYSDFVYFAVGLGMAYQVADTNLQTNELRRIAIAQTLLGYLFGAVILASVINLVAQLA